jgi:hypothetical protein
MKDLIRQILNEDKQERFIQSIVDDLVRDTKLDFDELRITYPFTNYFTHHTVYTPLPDRNLYYSFRKPPYYEDFSEYCEERFGLTDKEVSSVWEKYRIIISNKF